LDLLTDAAHQVVIAVPTTSPSWRKKKLRKVVAA
jgi:hypothetical protein